MVKTFLLAGTIAGKPATATLRGRLTREAPGVLASSLEVPGITTAGFVDTATGSFSLFFFPGSFGYFCGASFRAQVSTDGSTFTGTMYTVGPTPGCDSPTCFCTVEFPVGPLSGSRSPCGNGIVDPGETCDDANLGRNGHCCVLGCSLAAAGQACTSDGNRCTSDVCDAAGTCTHPAGNAGTVCRPAVDVCDVAESCNAVDSDCPADAKQPDGTGCSDGQFCNGEETTCQNGVCQSGAAPCLLLCDETHDQCVTGCLPAPQVCRTAGKSVLLLKNNSSDDAKDRLVWKWIKGAQTSQTEFGDPTATADYALCIYAGTASALVGQSVIPASATKWNTISTKGYKYNDPAVAEGGIDKIVLKGSTQNKSKVQVKGKGAGLPDLPLPVTAPVTVQLVNGDNGLCWGASYISAELLKNEMGQLKAKAPQPPKSILSQRFMRRLRHVPERGAESLTTTRLPAAGSAYRSCAPCPACPRPGPVLVPRAARRNWERLIPAHDNGQAQHRLVARLLQSGTAVAPRSVKQKSGSARVTRRRD